MNLTLRFLIGALVFLQSAIPSNADAPMSASTGVVVIPIEVLPSGHIAIMAKINGKGPYRFIFDTGAPALVISESVSKASHILPTPFYRPFFTLLGNLGDYPVDSIAIGHAIQNHLVTSVWDHPTVDLLSKAYGRFEGLIGFPFFAHYRMTLDYKAKTMTLSPSGYQPEDTKEKLTRYLIGSSDPAPILAACQTIGIRVSKSGEDEAPGVGIVALLAASPAADAGLKVGDRLLTIDGRWTDTIQDCYSAAVAIESSRPVAVTFQRGGKTIKAELNVKPGI